MEIGEIYFWTATINKWQRLLAKDEYKQVILDALSFLNDRNKIDVYGFVIMPNHVHFIWRTKALNGKETAQGSFMKYTSHTFKKLLKNDNGNHLSSYFVDAANKKYEFWQRDSLAIHLFNEEVAYQKLNYIHFNPCTEYWQLAVEPPDYFFSSARFYEDGVNEFGFLKNLREEF